MSKKAPQKTSITPRTLEALRILRDEKPHTDSGFAELFWPDSMMHTKHSAAGTHGSRRGAGAWLCSGSYLAKLQKRGLIFKRHPTTDPHLWPIATLTEAGEDVLAHVTTSLSRALPEGGE